MDCLLSQDRLICKPGSSMDHSLIRDRKPDRSHGSNPLLMRGSRQTGLLLMLLWMMSEYVSSEFAGGFRSLIKLGVNHKRTDNWVS